MSYGLGDAQGYYGRRPVDRSFREFGACGHVVETRGSDRQFPTHGRLHEFLEAHGQTTCPICIGPQGAEFRQMLVRFVDVDGHRTSRNVHDQRHAENLIRMLFREGATNEATIYLNDVQLGNSWRSNQ